MFIHLFKRLANSGGAKGGGGTHDGNPGPELRFGK